MSFSEADDSFAIPHASTPDFPAGIFRLRSWSFIPSMAPADSAAGDRDFAMAVEVGIGRPALVFSAAG
jgi:hypothetical protein